MDAFSDADIALHRALPFYVNSFDYAVFSFHKSVKPVLQDGPCCGLVALIMAAQTFTEKFCSLKNMFETAVELGFTVRGEMFHAIDMSHLAEIMFDCKADVVENLSTNVTLIINHILKGHPVLIPYDRDKNNVPCQKKGHQAHWAVITGVCFAVPVCSLSEDYESSSIHHKTDGDSIKPFWKKAKKILVYAHQGQSKHMCIWELEELLQSNVNLFELNEKYSECDMVIPQYDKLAGIRDKAVLISPL